MEEYRPSEVIYQVYPSSFNDTSGSGLGDLRGIIEKLDYIKSLNVDAVWISPFFLTPEGPEGDGGYAISDYRAIDPKFGTMQDFKELLDEAHKRGLRIYTDFVLSHTASDHEWFQKSQQKDPKFKDHYVWHDGHKDKEGRRYPPNNWKSVFGGEAWSWCDKREQYYLHHFLTSQPALNHNAKTVQDAVLEEMKFWLDMGVDGFRLDALPFAICDDQFRNNPWLDGQWPRQSETWEEQYFQHSICQAEMIDLVARIRDLMDSYDQKKTTVGEVIAGPEGGRNSIPLAASYVDAKTGLDMCYTNALMGVWHYPNADQMQHMINYLETQFSSGGNCNSASNHDIPRSASRMTKGIPADKIEQALRQLMTLYVSMPGSFCLYQGEELGLSEAKIPQDIPLDKLKDPVAHTKGIEHSRDGCRTPIPWAREAKNGGFSTSDKPYLPMVSAHLKRAVDVQENDPQSMLNFTRDLMKWRQSQPALVKGKAKALKTKAPVLAVLRESKEQKLLCVFNFSANPERFKPEDHLSAKEMKALGIQKGTLDTIGAFGSKIYGAAP